MFKKFLLFFSIVLVLIGSLVGVYFKYIHNFEYQVFLESYDHGMLSVNADGTVGKDSKYRVTCKAGETLTVNINPERTDSEYYDLASLTINGADVTDDVRMLQYRFKVNRNTNIVATFKKGKRPSVSKQQKKLGFPNAPLLSVTNSTPYLGSYDAYNMRDPSIIYDEKSGFYYAFGSDNVVIRSKDLINWTDRTTYFNTPSDAETSEIMDFSQFKSVKSWAKTHGYNGKLFYSSVTNDRTPLAPEIVKSGDTYYLYFSLSKQKGANESAIFCVSTENLEKAVTNKSWTDCGLVISTCGYHKGSELSDKEKAPNAYYDESNAVHPSVLVTDEGKMYLAYGSYFGKENINGGIYLLELDGKTGLLKKDSSINSEGESVSTVHKNKNADFKTGILIAKPGFVPSLSKDDGSLVSACDLIYYEGYYYLFITYGVEEKNYEIRVARSRTAGGPYLDEDGHDLSVFAASRRKNQYSKGTLMIAGYNFSRSSDGNVSYTDIGKASPGSPCVIKAANGKWIMASQSQVYFKANGELLTGQSEAEKNEISVDALPSMEIRQILWTDGNWPLAVPEAYANEKLFQTVTTEQMYGNWDVVTFNQNGDESDFSAVRCNGSQVVSLFKNVTLSQSDISKKRDLFDLHFSKKDKRSFEIELDGETYTIYPVIAWDWELWEGTLTFTGTSMSGKSVWGKKTFSPYTGIYTDAFYYLLSYADDKTRAEFEEKLEKISNDPSQEELDKLTSDLLSLLQVQTLR